MTAFAILLGAAALLVALMALGFALHAYNMVNGMLSKNDRG